MNLVFGNMDASITRGFDKYIRSMIGILPRILYFDINNVVMKFKYKVSNYKVIPNKMVDVKYIHNIFVLSIQKQITQQYQNNSSCNKDEIYICNLNKNESFNEHPRDIIIPLILNYCDADGKYEDNHSLLLIHILLLYMQTQIWSFTLSNREIRILEEFVNDLTRYTLTRQSSFIRNILHKQEPTIDKFLNTCETRFELLKYITLIVQFVTSETTVNTQNDDRQNKESTTSLQNVNTDCDNQEQSDIIHATEISHIDSNITSVREGRVYDNSSDTGSSNADSDEESDSESEEDDVCEGIGVSDEHVTGTAVSFNSGIKKVFAASDKNKKQNIHRKKQSRMER